MTILVALPCDHRDDNNDPMCCSACFHFSIYITCKQSGIGEALSDKIADNALDIANAAGQFNRKGELR